MSRKTKEKAYVISYLSSEVSLQLFPFTAKQNYSEWVPACCKWARSGTHSVVYWCLVFVFTIILLVGKSLQIRKGVHACAYVSEHVCKRGNRPAGGGRVTTIAPLLGMTACSYPAMGNWGHAGVHPDRCAAVNHGANPHKVMRKKSMPLLPPKGACFVHADGVQVISFICIFYMIFSLQLRPLQFMTFC